MPQTSKPCLALLAWVCLGQLEWSIGFRAHPQWMRQREETTWSLRRGHEEGRPARPGRRPTCLDPEDEAPELGAAHRPSETKRITAWLMEVAQHDPARFIRMMTPLTDKSDYPLLLDLIRSGTAGH